MKLHRYSTYRYIKENIEELFDYKIEDIKTILKERGYNVKSLTILDSGMYGTAFILNNEYVLKVTNMKSEVYYANIIKDITEDNLVNIKDVFFHEYFDFMTVRIGFIIMEKLNTDSNKLFKLFIDYLHNRNNLTSRYKVVDMSEVIEFFKDKIVSIDDETIIKYWNMYISILETCEKYNLPIDDLRGRNIGFRYGNESVPVFFDIGDVYSSIKHDYSNIDILKKNLDI